MSNLEDMGSPDLLSISLPSACSVSCKFHAQVEAKSKC